MSLRGFQLVRGKAPEPQTCEIHRTHRPRNWTVEEHHVIPQAWQRLWSPKGGESLPPWGIQLAVEALWHPETVTLCPTGHRNVHFWLVKYMKEGSGESIPSISRPTTEQAVAQDAMTEFKFAGGSLAFLREQHAYGYA